MALAPRWVAVVLLLASAGCDDDAAVTTTGPVSECTEGAACECSDGASGRRVCAPEPECDCPPEPEVGSEPDAGEPDAATPAEDASTGGAGSDAALREDAAAPLVELGTTDEEERDLCDAVGVSYDGIRSCAFRRGGRALPGGARADILEIEYDSPGRAEAKLALLVIRMPDEPDLPTEKELAESYWVPGESVTYRLGPLRVDGAEVSIRVTLNIETYPNTGDPGADPGTIRDRVVTTIVCSPRDEWLYACEHRN